MAGGGCSTAIRAITFAVHRAGCRTVCVGLRIGASNQKCRRAVLAPGHGTLAVLRATLAERRVDGEQGDGAPHDRHDGIVRPNPAGRRRRPADRFRPVSPEPGTAGRQRRGALARSPRSRDLGGTPFSASWSPPLERSRPPVRQVQSWACRRSEQTVWHPNPEINRRRAEDMDRWRRERAYVQATLAEPDAPPRAG